MNDRSAVYTVPPLPDVIPNMPDWARIQAEAEAENMKRAYFQKLDNYFAQEDGWLQTQEIKRRNSPDPANYQQDPFPVAVPVLQLVAFASNGLQRDNAWADPDPRIKPPVLPAYVPPVEVPNGIHMVGAPPDQQILQMLKVVLLTVQSIDKRLTALENSHNSLGL